MAKDILYDIEAKKKLMNGIIKLTEVVKVTMGPKGRLVALDENSQHPHLTRDGVTVAKSIELPDHMENLGAQLVKEVAIRTAREVGDGTTTATVLAASIFIRSLKYVTAGADAGAVKNGIEAGVEKVLEHLSTLAIPVKTAQQIRQVASIAANQDEEIGNLISRAIERVGKDGIITIDEARGNQSSLSVTEGAKLESGYLSHHFITDAEKSVAVLEEPLILVTDQKINVLAEIVPLLESIIDVRRPLLIIADNVENEALSALVVNHTRGVLQTAAIKGPGFGDQRKEALEDIALLTGATLISEVQGHKINKVEKVHLGSAKKVIVEKDGTVIIEGAGDKTQIEQHIRDLKAAYANDDIEKLNRRIAMLTGGVVKIELAAQTESEMKEKKERADDALQATRAAMEEGIVMGGGVALLRCAQSLETEVNMGDEQKVAFTILKSALHEPALAIIKNAGLQEKVILNKIVEGKDDFGFNAATEAFEPLVKAGIIDPAKVVRVALENAVSVAGMMLTTYCLIAEEEKIS